jgi:UDP-GlcNAc3NAcA epimerase
MDSRTTFADVGHRRVCNCGDVMYDNSIFFASLARQRSTILQDLRLQTDGYILATVHRDNNTDNPDRLQSILQALADVGMQDNIPVVLPLHPRTKKILNNSKFSILNSQFLHIIPPASFLEINLLEQNAKIVMTDSGGVQKEAFFFERPCVILRPETEWVEIVNHGAGIIADADYDRIVAAYRQLVDHPVRFPHLFGDGHAAEKILETILNN